MQINEAMGFITQALQDFANTLPPSLKAVFSVQAMQSLGIVNTRLTQADEMEAVIVEVPQDTPDK